MRSNRFIKRLDLYIIKKFLGTYVFAIALIISIAVVFDFNEKMDKFMERSAPWSSFLISQICSVRCSYLLLSYSLLQSWPRTLRLSRCSLPV